MIHTRSDARTAPRSSPGSPPASSAGARHHLVGQRKAPRGHDQRDHHLHAVRALVAAVAELALGERRVALEIGGGQIVKQDIEARLEQRLPALPQKREERPPVPPACPVQRVAGEDLRTSQQIAALCSYQFAARLDAGSTPAPSARPASASPAGSPAIAAPRTGPAPADPKASAPASTRPTAAAGAATSPTFTRTTSHARSGASRSAGNSAICVGPEAPRNTSIERHHAARWLSLISPR